MAYLASLSDLESNDIVDDEFTIQEVEFALKRLICRKAGGVDGLSPEHLKHGGPLLNIWLKIFFNAFIFFEYVSACMLTAIIRRIYKGKGKDSFNCHSYRGITMTSVIMKNFEYVMLDRILPVLKCNGHPFRTQTEQPTRNYPCVKMHFRHTRSYFESHP